MPQKIVACLNKVVKRFRLAVGILDLCFTPSILLGNMKNKNTVRENMKRYCKACGIEIGKGKSFC